MQKGQQAIAELIMKSSTGLTKFLESWFGIVNAHHYFFLALLGTITATVCFFTDLCTVYLIDCMLFQFDSVPIVKLRIVWDADIGYDMRYFIYVALVVVFMMISVSMS